MTAIPTDTQAGSAELLVALDQSVRDDIREQTLLDWVPISKMFVAAFGRPLSTNKVQKMKAQFDPMALGVILLSFRANDTYSILDGQHRVALAMEMGRTEMASRIYIDLSYQREARLYNAFATVNKQSALDKFRAKLEAQDSDALAIVRVLGRYGLEVATDGPAMGKLQAVHALEVIYDQHGVEFFDNVIGTLHSGWEEAPRAYISPTLLGMAAFWLRYHEVADLKHLQDVMHKIAPERILQASLTNSVAALSSRGYGSEIWGRSLLDAYNHGMRRHKLESWEKKVVSEKGKLSYQQRSAAKRREEELGQPT